MGKLLTKLDVMPGAKSAIIVLAAVGLWVGSYADVVSESDFDKGLQLLGILFGGAFALKVDRFNKAIREALAVDEEPPAPPAPGPTTGQVLGVILGLALCLSGCAFVRYDGAGARAIAESALSVEHLPGAVVTAEDCDPIAAFQAAMLDEKGGTRSTRWLWEKKHDAEPRVIARLAQIQLDGCNLLRERESTGQVADRMRATLAAFWTRTGLVVGPVDPD